MHRAVATGQPPRVTFPVLAVFFAFSVLKGWTVTLDHAPDFSTPPELLERLFKGTFLALSTAAVAGLWTGAPWLMRLLGAWYAVLLGWMVAQHLAIGGLAALGDVESWAYLLFAGGFYLLPVLYVRDRLHRAAPPMPHVPIAPRPYP